MFLRVALLLLSKKKYFPQLFSPECPRECRIYKHQAKVHKVVNGHITFLSQFLQVLGKEIPQGLEELGRLIMKARKVESNLYALMKESREGGKDYYTQEEIHKIYKDSHVKH